MANTSLKFGNGNWAIKENSALAYSDQYDNFKPLPFDFSRASSGTIVNKEGLIETVGNGLPRIDFADSEDGALKLEPQSTNLLPYSSDFSQWSKIGSSLTSGFASPSGDLSASKITFSTSSLARVDDTSSVSGNSNTFTATVWLKSDTPIKVRLDLYQLAIADNLEEVNVTTEWQRFSITATASSSSNNMGLAIFNETVGGAKDLYIWGAQLEQQSYATLYIPTDGAIATRLADVCGGSGNASTFNSTEGVLYAEVSRLHGSLSQSTIRISKSGSEFLGFSFRADGNIWAIVVNGGYEVLMQFIPPNFYDTYKIALKYKSNDSAFFVNGVKVDSNTTSLLSLTELNNLSYSSFYGKTKALAVFPILTDAELQSLTTI